jgi:Putative Actinobacterial Holin-X, holin superfamily III
MEELGRWETARRSRKMEGRATAGNKAREPLDERSLAELTKRLTDQASTLAQKEAELAKAELVLKGKRLGFGAGAFGASALLGLYALGALIATAILAMAIVLDAWLAALIVAAGLGAAAGVLALTGKRKVEEGTPPVPEQAVESTKADVEHTRRRAKEGRQ